MTLPPIHSERYLDFICRDGLSKENILKWLGDAGAIGRRQRMYSELAQQIAREEQAEIIDIRAAFPQDERSLEALLCEDGIHPNPEGQKRILAKLRDARERITLLVTLAERACLHRPDRVAVCEMEQRRRRKIFAERVLCLSHWKVRKPLNTISITNLFIHTWVQMPS